MQLTDVGWSFVQSVAACCIEAKGQVGWIPPCCGVFPALDIRIPLRSA
jgi:hypothetical protein